MLSQNMSVPKGMGLKQASPAGVMRPLAGAQLLRCCAQYRWLNNAADAESAVVGAGANAVPMRRFVTIRAQQQVRHNPPLATIGRSFASAKQHCTVTSASELYLGSLYAGVR
jgi:hypothetical protein